MYEKAMFRMVGELVDKRELTSDKAKQWRGYVVSVATIGATHELNTSAEQWSALNVGGLYLMEGHVENDRGRTRLVLERSKSMSAKPAA